MTMETVPERKCILINTEEKHRKLLFYCCYLYKTHINHPHAIHLWSFEIGIWFLNVFAYLPSPLQPMCQHAAHPSGRQSRRCRLALLLSSPESCKAAEGAPCRPRHPGPARGGEGERPGLRTHPTGCQKSNGWSSGQQPAPAVVQWESERMRAERGPLCRRGNGRPARHCAHPAATAGVRHRRVVPPRDPPDAGVWAVSLWVLLPAPALDPV